MIKHAEQLDNNQVEVQDIETGAIAVAKVSPFVGASQVLCSWSFFRPN
jgi:hypothetical protein